MQCGKCHAVPLSLFTAEAITAYDSGRCPILISPDVQFQPASLAPYDELDKMILYLAWEGAWKVHLSAIDWQIIKRYSGGETPSPSSSLYHEFAATASTEELHPASPRTGLRHSELFQCNSTHKLSLLAALELPLTSSNCHISFHGPPAPAPTLAPSPLPTLEPPRVLRIDLPLEYCPSGHVLQFAWRHPVWLGREPWGVVIANLASQLRGLEVAVAAAVARETFTNSQLAQILTLLGASKPASPMPVSTTPIVAPELAALAALVKDLAFKVDKLERSAAQVVEGPPAFKTECSYFERI
ncbi:hypothetical protein JCM1840_007432 [Sporobolomyces johnsonii]